jgi:folylpolyglutamate synthase/dihydropteroate synthase
MPDNLELARSAAVLLELPVNFSRAVWPARFELFNVPRSTTDTTTATTDGATAAATDDRKATIPVVIDGAHNRDSICKLLSRIVMRYGDVPLTVIFGAAADKNVSSMLQALTAHCCSASDTTTASAAGATAVRADTVASLLLVTAKHPRAASAAQLAAAAAAAAAGASVTPFNNSGEQQHTDVSVYDALLSALSHAGKDRVVLVCGSLVVAAEARAALYKHWPQLFTADDWVHYAGENTAAA